MKSKSLPNYLPFLIPFLLLGAIAWTQNRYDISSHNLGLKEFQASLDLSDPLVPSPTALKIISLGRPEVAADILWLSTIQYFGSGRDFSAFKSFGSLLDRITQLDPRFEYPYEFGMVVLPYMNQSDQAITLGLRAQQALPNDGLLTYYLATIYHLNKHDYRNAAKYYQLATTEPGAPGAARTLAATALSKLDSSLNDRLVAMTFWQTVYENAKNPDDKDRAEKWFTQLSIVYNLEKAAQNFQEQKGRYPASLQELKDEGFIPGIPESPVGRQMILDPNTGKINFDRPIQ